ncbi:hypothetical protein GCM10027037_30410 [Mucilaginibacter koreensis]
MKLFFTLLLITIYINCLAQKHNTYYFKNNGREVSHPDSADYVRVVSEPDAGSELYNVAEYYNNKARKLIGKSSDVDPVRYQGYVLTFFPNGKRESVTQYVNGFAIDTASSYYPNGKKHIVKHYMSVDTTRKSFLPDNDSRQIIDAVYDSTGTALAINGNGRYISYNDVFTTVVEQGELKNGKRTGVWTGIDKAMQLSFTETYEDGKLMSGTSTDKTNSVVAYTGSRSTQVDYQTGFKNYYRSLSDEIFSYRYHLTGDAVIKCYINSNGKIEDIKFAIPMEPRLEPLILKAVSKFTNWIAATKYGRNVGTPYIISLSFRSEVRFGVSSKIF